MPIINSEAETECWLPKMMGEMQVNGYEGSDVD